MTTHRGLTLFEVLLVMAIIVLFAAMAVPSLQRSFQNQKVINGAEVVRAHCNEARVLAMREGEVYAFFYQLNTGRFVMAPFDQAQDVLQQSGGTLEDPRVSEFQFELDWLPRDIVFSGGSIVENGRSDQVQQQGDGLGSMQPVLFYPDGQCQDAEIYVMNQLTGDRMIVKVRGLTGSTSVGEVLDSQ